jgi:hypothetical protein
MIAGPILLRDCPFDRVSNHSAYASCGSSVSHDIKGRLKEESDWFAPMCGPLVHEKSDIERKLMAPIERPGLTLDGTKIPPGNV